jgi:hypothetical protein
METPASRVQAIIINSILPVLCSIIIGFVIYQFRVFDRQFGAFQFVWTSIVGSVFYYLLVNLRSRDAFAGFLLLLMLTFLTTSSTRLAYILRDIFYVAAIGASIFVYFKYFSQIPIGNYAYPPFMLAGIYAVFYMIASEIHFGILSAFGMEGTGGTVIGLASTTSYFGVLIGFAIGTGIALNPKLAEHMHANALTT